MFHWRMRCDPKTKCRIPKQYDWLFIIILESAFLAIFAFFQALSINMSFWRCSGDNIANDTLLHRLHLSLAHQLSDSILAILETVHLKWLRTPPWHHISYLDYTTEKLVVAWDLSESSKILESGRCWSTNLNGRGMSYLDKDIWAIDATMRPGYTT